MIRDIISFLGILLLVVGSLGMLFAIYKFFNIAAPPNDFITLDFSSLDRKISFIFGGISLVAIVLGLSLYIGTKRTDK